MDKELMDKMNEALKANGKRELSLDEMDKVSGGNQGLEYYTLIDGSKVTETELTHSFQTLTAQIGYDAAAVMFCEMTGLSKQSIHDSSQDINILLNKFYNMQDKGGKGTH